MTDPRWTEATFDRVIEAMGPTIETQGTWAEAANEILAALADAGLLVEPGSETREEWGVRYPRFHPEPVLCTDEARARRTAEGVNGIPFSRTVHTGPWREAS